MKNIVYILQLIPFIILGQEGIQDKIDSLDFVSDMPYICHYDIDSNSGNSVGCGDRLFWNVVKLKSKAIPFLLDKLDDSTTTEVNVLFFGCNYTSADIAYVALGEIIHKIPTFELLGVEFDKEGCGYCSYWQYLNKHHSNRQDFKKTVQHWYETNKDNLIWVENDNFSSCDCNGKHPNGGHYELKK